MIWIIAIVLSSTASCLCGLWYAGRRTPYLRRGTIVWTRHGFARVVWTTGHGVTLSGIFRRWAFVAGWSQMQRDEYGKWLMRQSWEV